MASTAAITLTVVVTGLPEGTEQFSKTLTNSTAVGTVNQAIIGTSGIAAAAVFTVPVGARGALLIGPGAAGTSSIMRLSPSTVASSVNALPWASTGFAFIPVLSSNAGISTATFSSALVVWTTGTVSTANATRVSFF